MKEQKYIDKKVLSSSQQGFTLLELLTVMVVVITTGTIIGAILLSALRGATKTTTITAVKQNGDYALSQMAKMIRFSKSFDGVSVDNIVYTTNCTDSSAIEYKYVRVTSFDGGQTIFACVSQSPATIASSSASVINQARDSMLDTSAVIATSCVFTCSQNTVSDLPTIGINFSLSQRTTSSFFEQSSSQDFRTSVIVRNASR